jgi:hypothetical protein
LKDGDKIKKTINWGIDRNGEFGLYQLLFLLFGLKNDLANFLKVPGIGFLLVFPLSNVKSTILLSLV